MWIALIAAVFYPLIDSGWSDPGPLPESLRKLPETVCMIPTDRLQEQADFYRKIKDPVIRSRIAIVLRTANNPAAPDILMDLLKRESDARLQADLLVTVLQVCQAVDAVPSRPDLLYSFLNSPLPQARQNAALLLILAEKGIPQIADMLAKENSASVAPSVLSFMAESETRLTAEQIRTIAKSKNVSVRNSILKYLAQTSPDADSEDLLKESVGKDPAARIAVMQGLAVNKAVKCPKLVRILLKNNANASIRFAAASMRGRTADRKNILLDLMGDPLEIIRAEAAVSLGFGRYEDGIECLAQHLKDENKVVRDACGDSLAKITGSTLPKTILDAAGWPDAQDPVLNVIRASGNPAYAAVTAEILKSALKAGKEDLAAKAIRILQSLNAVQQAVLVLNTADHPSAVIRQATAEALRIYPGEAANRALKKLIAAKEEAVSMAAVETIRILKEPSFAPDLATALRKITWSSDYRAAVSRAWGAIPGKLDPAAIRTLEMLILEPCIPAPMSPPCYDAALSRATALLLLLKASQAGNPLCRQAFDSAWDRLEHPSAKQKQNGFEDPLLTEYLRQIRLLRDGKEVTRAEMPHTEPDYPVQKLQVK